jgi:xanthosine utilization system XapX-like protein
VFSILQIISLPVIPLGMLVGLFGLLVLSGVFQFVVGLLWMALGVAMWRHVPENQHVGTTPQIS